MASQDMRKEESGHLFRYTIYKHNHVLQFIFGLAIIFVLFQILAIIFMILATDAKSSMPMMMVPNAAILDWNYWLMKPWTIITFGLMQTSFWHLLPNALWLYLFGNIFQQYHQGKELPYIFVITSIVAGILYLLILRIAGLSGIFLLSTTPGVVGLATATLLLHPRYRIVIGELRIPLWLIYIVFLIISVLGLENADNNAILLISISALVGAIYSISIRSSRYVSNVINRWWHIANKYVAQKDRPTSKYGWSTEKLQREAILKNPNKADEITRIATKLERDGIESLSMYERVLIFGIE